MGYFDFQIIPGPDDSRLQGFTGADDTYPVSRSNKIIMIRMVPIYFLTYLNQK